MDEHTASMDTFQLDDSTSLAYEQYLVPALFASWAKRLVELVDLKPGQSVLDAGCGTGIVARTAVVRLAGAGELIGLDSNQSMLNVARSVSPASDVSIEWKLGDVVEMPFPDQQFDVVFCQQVIQFVPDESAVWREFHRVLMPGGKLILAVWRSIDRCPGFAVLAQAFEKHAGASVGSMMQAPFDRGDAAEHRAAAESAGFDDVRILIGIESSRFPSAEELVRQELESTPIGAALAGQRIEQRNAMVQHIAESLRPYTDDEGVVFPIESHIIIAKR